MFGYSINVITYDKYIVYNIFIEISLSLQFRMFKKSDPHHCRVMVLIYEINSIHEVKLSIQ